MGAGCRERVGVSRARNVGDDAEDRRPGAFGWAWVWLYTLERDYLKALAAIDLLPAEGKVDQNSVEPPALIRANFFRLIDGETSPVTRPTKRAGSSRANGTSGPRMPASISRWPSHYAGLERTEDALREGQLALDLFPP